MRRMDIDQDGKVMYADFSEYIKPRVEWSDEDNEKPGVQPGSPRWSKEKQKMISLQEVEETKYPQQTEKSNTEIRIYQSRSLVGSPEAQEATRFSDQKRQRSSESPSPEVVKITSPNETDIVYLPTEQQSTE